MTYFLKQVALMVFCNALLSSCNAQQAGMSDGDRVNANFEMAAEYSNLHRGDAILIMQKGQIVLEEYQNGYNAEDLHILASGSKSFSCAISVSAISDGFLTFNERVANTITEWQNNPLKSKITVQQLLSLTSWFTRRRVPAKRRSTYCRNRQQRCYCAGFDCKSGRGIQLRAIELSGIFRTHQTEN